MKRLLCRIRGLTCCSTRLLLGLLLLNTGLLTQTSAEHPGKEMRVWTSVSGAEITARAAGFEEGMLVLVTEDDRRLAIAPGDLSAEDAELAEALAAVFAADAPAVEAETGPDKLPVFTSGPHAGKHAVYNHPLMDAEVDVNGRVNIYPKHEGERVGRPLRLSLHTYYSPPGGRTRGRPVAAFGDPPQPRQQPGEITLQGKLEDEVPFVVHYSFDGAQVTAWGWCEDPRDLRFPTRYRLTVRVPASHAIDPQTTQAERERKVAGHALHLREIDGRRASWQEYNYHEAVRFPRRAREARIEAALWSPRVIRVESRDRDLPLRPWIYAGRSLWQGYSLILHKSDPSSRSPVETITVTVD